jgi:hypothetical protein
VPGAVIDLEARLNKTVISKSGGGMLTRRKTSVPLTFGFHPTACDITLSVPMQMNESVTQMGRNWTTGVGDMSLSISRGLGMTGQTTVQLGVTVPTGRDNIYGYDHKLFPKDMQVGSGVFGANLGLDYTRTKGWGVVILGGSYSSALFYLETTAYENWDDQLQRAKSKTRELAWAHDKALSYVNDQGVRRSDMVSLHAYIGIKKERMMHSLGLQQSIPLAPDDAAYVEYSRENDFTPLRGENHIPTREDAMDSLRSFIRDTATDIDPIDDTTSYSVYRGVNRDDSTVGVTQKERIKEDTELFSLNLSYGMEVTDIGLPFPVFFSVSLPLVFDMEEGIGFNGYTIGAGMKYMLF